MRLLSKCAYTFVLIVFFLTLATPLIMETNPLHAYRPLVSDGTSEIKVSGSRDDSSSRPWSPFLVNGKASLQSPSFRHWLGTDILGRDILARLIFGARVSFWIGILATIVSLLLGIPLGALSGLVGGRVDTLFNRITELFYAIPMLLLLILVSGIFEFDVWVLAILLGVFGWIIPARYMRGEVIKLKEMNYVAYARVTGASTWHIMKTHLIPNGIGPVLVSASFNMANLILVEATLSFLGLGVRPPMPSWGGMIYDGLSFLQVAPWLIYPPMIMLFLSIFSYDVIGQDLKRRLHSRS